MTASRGALALAALLAAPGALADQPAAIHAPVVQAVADCRKIDDSAQRLACYDKTVAAMVDAESKGDLVSIDREQRRAARRQAFGFTLPSLSFLERGEKPEELNRVSETVATAFQGAEGRWVLHMQDGAVWRQTDDAELSRSPHAGSQVVIMKGLLGSYMMDIDGQPGVKAHRDN
ncbi:MAG: hypothetical protein ACHP7N_04115 [Caulobacterales bacterium]